MKVDNIVFYDCILYILYGDRPDRLNCEAIYLNGQYDDPISLDDIAEGYRGVFMVIEENPLDGRVYRYGNHGDYWEEVGKTRGFA